MADVFFCPRATKPRPEVVFFLAAVFLVPALEAALALFRAALVRALDRPGRLALFLVAEVRFEEAVDFFAALFLAVPRLTRPDALEVAFFVLPPLREWLLEL